MAAYPTTVNADAYTGMITRPNATALIPAPVADTMIQGATENSAFLRMATRLPNMSSATLTLPVLSALPTAYFVTGEAGDGSNAARLRP